MKKIIFLFSFVLLLSSVSYAQTNSTYKATLSKMMEVSGAKNTYKAVLTQIVSMFKQQKPEVPAAVWTEFEVAFSKVAEEDLLNILLPVYQKHMSEADLKNMIVFYETPTGKRFAEKTPLITQDSMAAGQEWGKKLGEEFAKKMQEKGY